jgi:hypothetical protein
MRGCSLLASSLARRPPLPLVRRLASLLTKPAVLRRLVSTGASHAAVAPGASPAVPAASGSALAVALRTKRLRLPLLGKLSVSELFGHTAFALAATAFLDPDILNLRLLSVASGAATLIFTYYHPVGRPLWLPFGWNVLFMTINAGHIYSILSSKWEAERMPPQAVDLWKAVFSHQGVSAVDFNKLLACGTWTTLRKGTALQAEGQPSASIFLLVQGGADVSVGGTKTHRLSQHQFIGDMGLSSGIAISQPVRGVATVTTNQQTTCLVWSRAALHELLEREPMLRVRASVNGECEWRVALRAPWGEGGGLCTCMLAIHTRHSHSHAPPRHSHCMQAAFQHALHASAHHGAAPPFPTGGLPTGLERRRAPKVGECGRPAQDAAPFPTGPFPGCGRSRAAGSELQCRRRGRR